MSNSDDTNELDNYGVWVKKPPKDIPVDDSEIMDDSFDLDSDLPDFSSLDSEISVGETADTGADTSSDNFDISVDGITEESLEDPFADVDFGESSVEEPAVEETADFSIDEPAAETPAVEEDDFNLDDVTADIQLDDINFDVDSDLGTDSAETEETSETAAEPALDDFNVEGLAETSAEVSDDNLDFEIDEKPEAEIITDAGDITIDEIEDGEVDLDNFLGDSDSSETSDAGDSVDVSADFGLDEGSTDSVDLGDFLGDGDLSDFGGESKPKTETIEDQDPLNIDLSFDESANSFATEDVSEADSSSELNSNEERSTGEGIDTESIDISDFGVGEEETGFTGPEDAINEEKQEVVDYDMKVTADSDDDVTVSMNDVISGNIENDTSSEIIEETPVVNETTSNDTEISAKGQEILQQIVGELASLKDEIKNLKTDFAEIKNHGTDFEIKEEENTGFFSDGDEDDTIALSGDELSNILNNAEFLDESAQEEETENSVEEQIIEEDVSEESVSSNDQFEATIDDNAFNDESIFDEHADEDIQNTTTEISEDLPEEIEIPKLDENDEDIETSDFSSTIEEDPIDNILSEDAPITDSLTDEKIDYISEDSNNPVEEDDLADLDLPSPTLDDAFEQESNVDEFKADNDFAIEEEPVVEEPVIEETADEPVVEETSVEEPALDDDSSIFEEPSASPVVSNDEITGDLKSEIKSVLSYMDQLLENLPEDKISEFAQSEHFVTYKKLFQELGLS